jgi:tRNA G18 (ribose-2'-O)-methylase SpoU
MGQRWLTDLSDLVEQAESDGVPVYFAQRGVIEAMTGFHLHRGALASMQRPLLVAPEVLLQNASRVVVLEDIVDHSNVGAVFRSAAALGVDAVLITPRCADPLYRRAVRVSMGTVFQVPWTRIDTWPGGLRVLQDNGFTVAAFALGDGAISLDDLVADQPDRLAMIFGPEGDGLSRRAIRGADLVVRIPMAGGVDSLNMAAASAVAIWALRPPPRSPAAT